MELDALRVTFHSRSNKNFRELRNRDKEVLEVDLARVQNGLFPIACTLAKFVVSHALLIPGAHLQTIKQHKPPF
jgi:hypothetical protein